MAQMSAGRSERTRRVRDPAIEEGKLSAAASFFIGAATQMNGRPPTEEQTAKAAQQIASGMPPYWDSRRRAYL